MKATESNFAAESRLLPPATDPTVETVTIRSSRLDKAIVAREAKRKLEAALLRCYWKEVQQHAETIAQMARWLQLSDESIENNS